MGNFEEDQSAKNPKKVWATPDLEIISDGNIESLVTVNFIEGGPTPAKGTIASGS